MNDWEAIKNLGNYIGPGFDVGLADDLSRGPDGERSRAALRSAVAGAFRGKYDDRTVVVLADLIFGTDFRLLGVDGEPIDVLSRDVFRRLSWLRWPGREAGHALAYEEFAAIFRRFIRSFLATFKGLVHTLGLKKEPVSLGNPGLRDYLAELRDLPCRKLAGPVIPDITQGDSALYDHVEALLKKYEGDVLDKDCCRGILDLMGKLSGCPGYFKALGGQHKLIEARPIILAISDLQLHPVKETSKNDLLSALAVLLFNVYATPRLLKFVARFRPAPENELLSYEYYAVLAMNHLAWGKPEEAMAFNEIALGFAADGQKRANARILSSCIHLGRRDYDAALADLYNCASMTHDRHLRAVAHFYMGIVNYETDDFREALECFKMAAAFLENEADAAAACNNIGACALLLRDAKGAAMAFEEAARRSHGLNGNTAKACRSIAYGCLGVIRQDAGDQGRAAEYYKESLRLQKDLHDKKRSADQLGNLGLILKSRGEYGSALEHFKAALGLSSGDDYPEGALFALDQLEQLLALEGRYEDSERLRLEAIRRYPGISKTLGK